MERLVLTHPISTHTAFTVFTIPQPRRKALALISGGLDSRLAAKVVMEQGVQVEGVNFVHRLCVEGHTHAIRKSHQDKPKHNNPLWVAETLGIQLRCIDIVAAYQDIVLNLRHGYGAPSSACARSAIPAP